MLPLCTSHYDPVDTDGSSLLFKVFDHDSSTTKPSTQSLYVCTLHVVTVCTATTPLCSCCAVTSAMPDDGAHGSGSESLESRVRASVARLHEAGFFPSRAEGPAPPPIGHQEGEARDCGFVPPRTLHELRDTAGGCWRWMELQPQFCNPASLPRMIALASVDEARSSWDATVKTPPCVPHARVREPLLTFCLARSTASDPHSSYDVLRDEQNAAWSIEMCVAPWLTRSTLCLIPYMAVQRREWHSQGQARRE